MVEIDNGFIYTWDLSAIENVAARNFFDRFLDGMAEDFTNRHYGDCREQTPSYKQIKASVMADKFCWYSGYLAS